MTLHTCTNAFWSQCKILVYKIKKYNIEKYNIWYKIEIDSQRWVVLSKKKRSGEKITLPLCAMHMRELSK